MSRGSTGWLLKMLGACSGLRPLAAYLHAWQSPHTEYQGRAKPCGLRGIRVVIIYRTMYYLYTLL